MEEPLSSAPDVVRLSKLTSCGSGDIRQGRLNRVIGSGVHMLGPQ